MIWFFHGFLGQPSDWKASQDYFEKAGFESRCPDILLERRHGESLESLASRFAKHILLEDPAPILCGYSFGGRFVLHLLEHINSAKAAIFISTHFGFPQDDLNARTERIKSDQAWGELLATTTWDKFMEKWNAQPMFLAAPESSTKKITENITETHESQSMKEARRLLWSEAFTYASLGLQKDFSKAFAERSTPVLLMAGQRDSKFASHMTLKLAQIPSAKLNIIQGSGHRVPWDKAQEFYQSMHNFLESLTSLGKN